MQPNFERQRRYERRQAQAAADVGELPAIKNPKRRIACRLDLHRFLVEYFPATTGKSPLSNDHRRAIERIQRCAIEGGRFCQAFPRGFGKTTISENSAIWATAYGHRKFVPIFGATANDATGNIESIKLELSENELLLEDFPEICVPIVALEGKSQRCASQTHSIPCDECGGLPNALDGLEDVARCEVCSGRGSIPSLTHIEWTGDTIVYPTMRVPEGWGTIKGPAAGAKLIESPSSGAIMTARGLTGALRGMKHKRPDGTQQRPDFIILDDPQTDKSASTPLQVHKALNRIKKGVLKLGAHGKKLAVVMNATVIAKEDLVDQLLDPQKNPAWQSERIKMIRKWSDAHETLWLTDYAAIRNDYSAKIVGDQERAHKKATAFYKKNRKAMDAGAEVTWTNCLDEDTELSAIQHAYNLLIDDGPEAFASECQNEPLEDQVAGAAKILKADQIAEKLNHLDRGVLPATATQLVAFIDPKETILYWTVLAFEEGFGGYVVDYGTFPDQDKKYFSSREVKKDLARVTGLSGLEAQIAAGLEQLTNQLAGREWKRDDGSTARLGLCLIDRNYPKITALVDRFCRTSRHAAILLPSRGRFYGASSSRMMSDYPVKPGERSGLNWRIPPRGSAVRHVYFDTNFYKGFIHERLSVPRGAAGSLTLYGNQPGHHELIADHLLAETPVAVTARGRTVIEFKEKASKPDNDFLDCIVGCHVGASVLGIQLAQLRENKTIARRIRLSEIQKARRLGLPPPTDKPATPAASPQPDPEPAGTKPAAKPVDPPAATPMQPQRRRVRLSDLQRRRNA